MFKLGASHTLETTHVEFFSDEDEPELDLGNTTNSYTVPTTPNTRIHKDHPTKNVIGDLKSTIQIRKMTKSTFEQGFLNAEELLQFKIQQVWKLVDLPNGKRAIGTQIEGINYEEVFAPVAKIEAIRLFLAYASFMGFLVYQMNVKSAFLYGTVEEEVYVTQPPGFKDPDHPDKVYKVVKALYGLHQAPSAWYETSAKYLLGNGFKRGKIDQTLFIKKQKGDILLVQVYVDDIIFGSTNKELCTAFEKLIKDKFQMSSMGELTFFLGLQVTQKEDGIFISQDKYVAEILNKFNYTDVKSASTPVDLEKPLVKDGDADDVDVYLYRSMIGYLMYLTVSRPDIMFAVCAYARFQVAPKTSHLLAIKRIFRYLKGKPTLSLWYSRDSPFELVAYTDSDYVGATQDRKSTTGESKTSGHVKRGRDTKIPQSSGPPLKVGDGAIHKELGDRMEKDATTASSLEAKHDSDAQTRFETTSKQSNDLPLSRVNTLGSGEDSMKLMELMAHQHDGEVEITASIDGQVKTITEASLRRHLKLEDSDVALEAAFISVDVDAGGTATTDIGLEAGQGSGTMHKTPTRPYDSPFPRVHTLGSDEGNFALINLILRVKKLEKKVKTNKASRRARIVISEDKDAEEDSSKQGRKISEIDKDPTIPLVQPEHDMEYDFDVSTTEGFTISSVPVTTASATPKVSTAAANLVYIRRSAEKRKDKGKAIMKEDESINEEENQRIARDAEIAKQLQEEFDRARQEQEVVAEADQAHDIDWSDPAMLRYHALQNRSFSVAEVRKNMCMYLKNQGGYKQSHFKGMSYEDIRPIFERVWDQNNAFVPKDFKIEKEVMKRPRFDFQQKSSKKKSREDSDEDNAKKQKLENDGKKKELKDSMDVVPRDDIAIDIESLDTKYPIVDWKTHVLTENMMYYLHRLVFRSSKNYKIFNDMLDDFDRQDVLDLHRLVQERYDTTSLEGYDLLLWGDLKILFEPNEEDEI
ncbi:putative ribonuclease H-like domain-containing protein [Tanacetum coccineum]